jgi:Rap1a immunity proteins
MKSFFITLTLLLFVNTISPASDTDSPSLTNWDPTGNDLVASCTETAGSFERGACLGYIHGVIGGFDMGSSGQQSIEVKGRPTVDLCVPNGVTNGQIVKVILVFADKHPEQLNNPADVIVAQAISNAWPAERDTEKGHVCTNSLIKEKP